MNHLANCDICDEEMPRGIHEEELGMCLDCSNMYWAHDHEGCSWSCMAELSETIRNQKKALSLSEKGRKTK